MGLPVMGGATLVAGSGLTPTVSVRAECIRIGVSEFRDVVATVQDLALYTTRYRREVSGLVGMDILRGAITRIDFPNRRLTMQASTPLHRKPVADIPIWSFKELPLVDCELPNSLKAALIVDTGCDCEIEVFDAVASALRLGQQSTRARADASTDLEIQSTGVAESLVCGNFRVAPVSVIARNSKDAASYNGMARPGMFGNKILAKFVVELDLKTSRLRLYSPE
jgi:hypothetical protein